MFEDSLLESGGRRKRQRNPWATVLSFTIEVAGIGLLVLIPMIYTEALPAGRLGVFIMPTAPTRSADPPPQEHRSSQPSQPATSNYREGVLVVPPTIPLHAVQVVDPPQMGVGAVGDSRRDCVGCIPDGARNDPFTERYLDHTAKPMLGTPIVTKPPTISDGVMEGLLIHRVVPVYPPLARQARVQGTVVLAATISRDGTIQNLTVSSGHQMLVRAAMDAVRQWRYRPYLLNNQPIDVETTVTVNFNLN